MGSATTTIPPQPLTSKQERFRAQAWAAAADREFWSNFSADDFHRLTLQELFELPPIGLTRAYELEINIDSLRSALTNV